MKRVLTILSFVLLGISALAQTVEDSLYIESLKEEKFDIRKYSTMNRQHAIGLASSTGKNGNELIQYLTFWAETNFIQKYRYRIISNVGGGAVLYTANSVNESTEFLLSSGARLIYGRGLIKLDIGLMNHIIVSQTSRLSNIGSGFVSGSNQTLSNYINSNPILSNYRKFMPNLYTGIYLEPKNIRIRLRMGGSWYFQPNYIDRFFFIGAGYAF